MRLDCEGCACGRQADFVVDDMCGPRMSTRYQVRVSIRRDTDSGRYPHTIETVACRRGKKYAGKGGMDIILYLRITVRFIYGRPCGLRADRLVCRLNIHTSVR